MAPRINKELLPFKLLYFFRNGGSAFIPMLSAIIRQKGVSEDGVGLIWTIAPITSAVINIVCGRTADAYRLHRALLVLTSSLLGVFLTGFFFLPDIPLMSSPPVNASVSAQCNTNRSLLFTCSNENISDSQVDEMLQFNIVNQEFSASETTEKCLKKCSLIPISFDNIYESQRDNVSIILPVKNNYFNELDIIYCGHACTGGEVYRTKRDQFSNKISFDEECNAKCTDICDYLCENGDVHQEYPLTFFMSTVEFWVIFIFIIVTHSTIHASGALADTLCSVVLGKDRHKFGRQRLFGSMGIGIMALIGGALVNYYSKGRPEPNYIPAVVISSTFLTISTLIATRIRVEVPGKQVEGSSLGDVVCSVRFILLMVTIAIVGTTFGVIGTFEFIYIEDVALAWDPDFNNVKLLQGLLLFFDRCLGNLPFLFISSYIIKKLTPLHTFTLTLSALSVRVLLYSLISNPWIFLPVHLLHGLSFGVFFTNMVTSASLLAPKGAQATLQSAVISCLTLGRSFGAFTGGLLLKSVGGSMMFLIFGVSVSCYTILYVIISCVIQRKISNPLSDDDRGKYKNPNEQTGKGGEESHELQENIFKSQSQLDTMA